MYAINLFLKGKKKPPKVTWHRSLQTFDLLLVFGMFLPEQESISKSQYQSSACVCLLFFSFLFFSLRYTAVLQTKMLKSHPWLTCRGCAGLFCASVLEGCQKPWCWPWHVVCLSLQVRIERGEKRRFSRVCSSLCFFIRPFACIHLCHFEQTLCLRILLYFQCLLIG